jgi:hypothetical protein
VFVGLLSLALTIAFLSFMTACKCVEYNIYGPVQRPVRNSDDDSPPPDTKYIYPPIETKTLPPTSDLPVIPIPGDKKDK